MVRNGESSKEDSFFHEVSLLKLFSKFEVHKKGGKETPTSESAAHIADNNYTATKRNAFAST